jgi:hypothetical protein
VVTRIRVRVNEASGATPTMRTFPIDTAGDCFPSRRSVGRIPLVFRLFRRPTRLYRDASNHPTFLRNNDSRYDGLLLVLRIACAI